MRFYGVDLIKEWESISVRRMLVLVEGLPPESATLSEDGWSYRDHLLANLIEITDIVGWRIWMGLGGDPKHADPIRIPRPGDEAEEKPKARVVETDTRKIAAWFAANSGA